MLPRQHLKQFPASAALPLLILVGAAAVEQLRLSAMLVLLLGLLVSLRVGRDATGRPTVSHVLVYAACLLVAITLVWDSLGLPASLPAGASCADLLSPFAIFRAAGAVVITTCLLLILRLTRGTPWELGLRWPSRTWVVASLVGLPAIGTAAAL
ncbi:MAG: hypothetical protein ABI578_09565, partial [Chloroflexota bacterium]